MDPSLSFHKHCNYVSDRIDKRNNMLKALVGSSWGQDKEITADLQRIEEIYRKLIDHLNQESLTLRVKDHSDMLSVQYLVNCLEEDHVSHGITIQEPRPRPMKETLHSRHHSTVLP